MYLLRRDTALLPPGRSLLLGLPALLRRTEHIRLPAASGGAAGHDVSAGGTPPAYL